MKGFSGLFSLYGVQLGALVLPLLSLPFLARMLGPEKWGQLAAVQALFLFLSFIVEYGFGFSATRKLAASTSSLREVQELVSGVMLAKILLSILLMVVSGVIFILFKQFSSDSALYFSGLFYAIVHGLTPLWYYQGVGKLPKAAWIDTAARFISFLLMFAFVRDSSDAWMVQTYTAICLLCAYIYLFYDIKMYIRSFIFDLSLMIRELRSGWSMFLFRIVGGLYTSANSAILRLYAPAIEVSFYAGADKILAAAKSSILPINQMFFPKISAALNESVEAAYILFLQVFKIMIGTALIVSVIVWFFASELVAIVLGGGYESAIPVLRVLIWSFPIIALTNCLGMQWMLPNHMDKQFNTVIISTGLVSIFLISYASARYGALGTAYAFLIAEALVAIGFLYYCLGDLNVLNSRRREYDS